MASSETDWILLQIFCNIGIKFIQYNIVQTSMQMGFTINNLNSQINTYFFYKIVSEYLANVKHYSDLNHPGLWVGTTYLETWDLQMQFLPGNQNHPVNHSCERLYLILHCGDLLSSLKYMLCLLLIIKCTF